MAGFTRLKFAVMAPFVLFVVLLGVGMSVAQYLSHVRESQRTAVQTTHAIVGSMRTAVETETAMMAGMLGILTERGDLADAFLHQDMPRLLRLTGDIFARMKRDQGITHFYFSDVNRVNRLRVHQPNRNGDTINRPSTLMAEQTQSLASGIELGPLGTLTLRVVMPWRMGDTLIGYLELGKEVDGLFDNLKQQFGLQPLMFLAKSRLNRQGWEEGMRMLGRTPQWDLLPDRVIAVSGNQPVNELLRLRDHPAHEMYSDGQWLMWLQLPLGDLSRDGDFDVGAIVDITSRHQEIRDFIWLVVQAVLVGSVLIISLFWLLLDRVEDRLSRTELRERHLGHILNLLRDRIHIFESPSLRLVGGNAMALTQLGGAEAVARASFDSIFANMDRQPVARLNCDDKTLTQEGLVIDGDGEKSSVETRFTYVGDSAEKPVVVAVSADISNRRQTERQLRTLWLALEQSPVSIMITDGKACIEYVNPAFTTLTGYLPKDVIGRTPKLLQSGQTTQATYQDLWLSLGRGEAWSGELINRRKDGRIYVDHSLISPVRDAQGRIVNYLAVKEDITERERHQKELAEMAAALGRSNAELEQFAYVASHDLRQPLRMVASYLTLIQRRLHPLESDVQGFFDFAVSGAKRMDALILALLEYSRVGSTKDSEAIDMAVLARETLALDQLSLNEVHATVSIEGSEAAPVRGNRIELQRLLDNLIGNALKYRRSDIAPRLRLGWRRQDGHWLFWLTDNGIGMDQDLCEQAFGMFQRLVDANQFEGTGIGLAVCRKIVEQHGGRIWCDSRRGEGSTFWFTLPDSSPQTQRAASA